MIVLADVSRLFDVPLDEYAVAAVADPIGADISMITICSSPDHYFNAGVPAIDMEYWRRHGVATPH